MGSIFLPYTAYTKEPDTCKKFWDSYKSQIFNKKPYYIFGLAFVIFNLDLSFDRENKNEKKQIKYIVSFAIHGADKSNIDTYIFAKTVVELLPESADRNKIYKCYDNINLAKTCREIALESGLILPLDELLAEIRIITEQNNDKVFCGREYPVMGERRPNEHN